MSFLGELKPLTSLTINFGRENLRYDYHKRFFEVSCDDIRHLVDGIRQLSNLKSLTLRGNKMDSKKMIVLMTGLIASHIEVLDLSFCQLDAHTIQPLVIFLCENEHHSLKHLELQGNYLGGAQLAAFAAGLAMFNGKLKCLGLSQNPLNDDGVVAIVNGLLELKYLRKIDFSCCEMGEIGVREILRILRLNSLRSVDISSVHVTDEQGTELVQCMENNFNMEELECRNCGLTLHQEKCVRLLLERNVYYIRHPYLFKEDFTFTEEDKERIDDILAKWRHSLLDRVEMEAIKFNRIDEIERSKYRQNFLTDEEFRERARI